MRIYLDHNATTPVAPAVLDVMARVLRDVHGNPSSVHYYGQAAKAVIDTARQQVAALLGGVAAEIVFTSGGTEADNLILRGAALAAQGQRRRLVASSIEHEAVLSTLKALERQGWPTTLVPVTSGGLVDPSALESVMGEDVALVSIMHANNEVGTVQPIAELAAIAHTHGALFHTDAVQSAGKLPLDTGRLGVDALSISAHKFYGPKGAGALWIRRGTRLVPTLTGGRQERNRRAGTENVPAIAGLGAAAADAAAHLDEDTARVSALRDRLEAGLLDRVAATVVNGAPDWRVANTSNMSFDGVEAESLLIALDLEGIAVSTGSACSSGTLEPSHVLRAMGLGTHRTQNSLRFSLGRGTTGADVDRVLDVLPSLVARLRQLARPARAAREA